MQDVDNIVFKQFIGNIPQFLWWKDINSIFLGCNESVATYFNLKNPEAIIGMSDFELFDSKEDADSVREMDQKVISTGIPHLNYEEYLDTPAMGKRWLSTSKIPLYDDSKKIIGTIGWFNDITAIKEMQINLDMKNKAIVDYSLQLEKTNHKLELANKDLQRFTYTASHDLKAPAQMVKAFANLLKKNEKDNISKESHEFLDFITDAADRMNALVNGILEFAKVDSKHLAAEAVDINQLVIDKIKDLKFFQDQKNAKITLNLPTRKIKAFKNLIGLVFYNLINNGIKYNNDPAPLISCDFKEEPDKLIFSVTDNGMGIDAGSKDVVFEPFKRLVGNKVKGTGIGLATCKKVVALHHGEIWIEESKKGRTVFMFSISKHI